MQQPQIRRRALVAATAVATMVIGAGAMLRADAQPAPAPPGPTGELVFVSVPPERILDTRNGNGDPRTPAGQKLGAGQTIELDVAGRALGGGAAVPGDAVAVMVNATITEATQPSFVTFFPSGQVRPEASSLNAVFGADSSGLGSENVPNMITVQIGTNGNVSIFNFAGATHVLADIAGYFVPAGAAGGTAVAAGDADPTGACEAGDVFLNTTTGQLFTCDGGVWTAGSVLGAADADLPDTTAGAVLNTPGTPVTVGTFTPPVAGDYVLNGAVDAQIETTVVGGALADIECFWDIGTPPVTFGESLNAGVDLDGPVGPLPPVPGVARGAFAADAHALDLAAGDEVDFICQDTGSLTGDVTIQAVLSGVRVLSD
jgi:hypothetical protein